MSNVIHISHARRAGIRHRKPARLAEPRPAEFGGLELPTYYCCPRDGCTELSPQPGFCSDCRAAHAAARIVRVPYRRDVS